MDKEFSQAKAEAAVPCAGGCPHCSRQPTLLGSGNSPHGQFPIHTGWDLPPGVHLADSGPGVLQLYLTLADGRALSRNTQLRLVGQADAG